MSKYGIHGRLEIGRAFVVDLFGPLVFLTRAVFGDYVSIYDIERSVKDKATVPIHYESRIARLSLNEEARPDSMPVRWLSEAVESTWFGRPRRARRPIVRVGSPLG